MKCVIKWKDNEFPEYVNALHLHFRIILEKVISDEECEELIRLFKNRDSKMADYVNFISEKMRNINLSLDEIFTTYLDNF